MSSSRFALPFALFLSFGAAAILAGEPASDPQREIAHLLQYVAASKCAFNRNGTWYSAQEAVTHLDEKYRYLKGRSGGVTAEEFLVHVATASSISGTPYLVRCEGQQPVENRKWLEAELRRYRAAGASSAK